MDLGQRREKVGRRRGKGMERVKMGKLKDREQELGLRLLQEVDWSKEGSVQEMWGRVAPKVRKCCREVLGVEGGGWIRRSGGGGTRCSQR